MYQSEDVEDDNRCFLVVLEELSGFDGCSFSFESAVSVILEAVFSLDKSVVVVVVVDAAGLVGFFFTTTPFREFFTFEDFFEITGRLAFGLA